MPQSLTNLLVHIVFSTKNRAPLLMDELQPEVFSYLAASLRDQGCPALVVGGYLDHIHALFRLTRTKDLATVIGDVKASSSKWLKTKHGALRAFAWQSGYAGFSVSASDAPLVVRYIEGQREHHRQRSFQEELRLMLAENQISFDERYLWD